MRLSRRATRSKLHNNEVVILMIRFNVIFFPERQRSIEKRLRDMSSAYNNNHFFNVATEHKKYKKTNERTNVLHSTIARAKTRQELHFLQKKTSLFGY